MKKTAKATAKKTTAKAKTSRDDKETKTASSTSAKQKQKASMGYKTENVDDEGALNDLFYDLLKDIYWAEKFLVKSLPDVEEASTTKELKSAIDEHWTVTKKQVKKLEQVFAAINEEPAAKKCAAMKGLVEEVNDIIGETDAETLTRDAAIIIASQKVEHYEIAAYGGLVALAKALDLNEAATLLNEILEEEKEADKTLSMIAEKYHINEEAAQEA